MNHAGHNIGRLIFFQSLNCAVVFELFVLDNSDLQFLEITVILK